MSKPLDPDLIYQEVAAGAKYRSLQAAFVRRVCEQESAKGRSLKETVKAVRGKLHQAGAAYQETGIPYDTLAGQLGRLGPDSPIAEWKAFARGAMRYHASSNERLPIIDDFFQQTLQDIAPVHSILDLACGLTPLAWPFMPLAPGASYLAGDIYLDMVAFLNQTFQSAPIQGRAFPLDLAAEIPQQPVQAAFLLKTLPCMEQQVKDYGRRLLLELKAEHLLVSFPSRSLGGRSKGMPVHYDEYIQAVTAGQDWCVKRFDFSTELAYLISK